MMKKALQAIGFGIVAAVAPFLVAATLFAAVILAGDYLNHDPIAKQLTGATCNTDHSAYPLDYSGWRVWPFFECAPRFRKECRYMVMYRRGHAIGSLEYLEVSGGTSRVGKQHGVWAMANPREDVRVTGVWYADDTAAGLAREFAYPDGSWTVFSPYRPAGMVFCAVLQDWAEPDQISVGDPGIAPGFYQGPPQ